MNGSTVSNIVNSAIQTYANTVGAMPGYEKWYYYTQILAAIITILGFIAVGIQLWYTSKSVNAADESAKAAKSAAEAAQEQVKVAQKQIEMTEAASQDTKQQMEIMLQQAKVDIESKMIASLPLFRLNVHRTFDHLSREIWEMTLTNVGNGPAFQINISLSDGFDRVLDEGHASMITVGENTPFVFSANTEAREGIVSYKDFHGFIYSQSWNLIYDHRFGSPILSDSEMNGPPKQVGRD
ncbi:hypothetical protein [Alicyclobacillus dauci]|uniref:Uncharacterized protein n=1 Tax=Alicyclobacillus dauci TaxID=1475485 RepID=A0ABY6Z875_9BACL|nr:hypothetical protein [Alicyclobacillus dauci]WAH39032.1 hypothetical protein NZD86_11390 [Alicyclobacillus dauci]